MLLKPRSRFYHYVYWVDGHRVCGSTKEVDKDRALRVLQKKQAAVRRGDEVPHEDRLRLGDPEAAVGSEVTLSLYGLLRVTTGSSATAHSTRWARRSST